MEPEPQKDRRDAAEQRERDLRVEDRMLGEERVERRAVEHRPAAHSHLSHTHPLIPAPTPTPTSPHVVGLCWWWQRMWRW